MQYMGGKVRQSKGLIQTLKPFINSEVTYVEPFCGALSSSSRVVRELHPHKVLLNDVNQSLILMLSKCFQDGCDWLPLGITRSEYEWYRRNQPMNDPLTSFIGFGYTLMGDYYASYAPYKAKGAVSGLRNKMKWLHNCKEVEFSFGSYDCMGIPDNAVVYCDPPYSKRKVHCFDKFDEEAFWDWVRQLSKRCAVFVSCYDCPDDFETVYTWGDTAAIKQNSEHTVTKRSHECEKLVRYTLTQRKEIN